MSGVDVQHALRAALDATGEVPQATVETHTAWVVLTHAHAYKVKKPVRFSFVDLGTAQRRRAVCREEARLNVPLAAALQYQVLALADDDGQWRLGDEDDPRAVEWLVRMRRFDENDTLAARVAAGSVGDDDVDRVARRLAAFHHEAPPLPRERWDEEVAARLSRNLAELGTAADDEDEDARRVAALRRVPETVLPEHAERLRERGARGCVVEGHGDVRAEHVVLEGDNVLIVDRLEFDPALRTVDVADDVAFLATDLEALGARRTADAIVGRYAAHGGDAGPPELRALYGVHRAAVRAKVALLRAHQRAGDDDRARATALLALAEHLAWRARPPLTLIVCGPPASGKSTLARALAERTGLATLSSDLMRKEQLGLAPAQAAPGDAYSNEARAAVYAELGRRARLRLATGESVIVDATFGAAPLRAAFLDALGPARATARVIACQAPSELLARRAATRTRATAAGSDAGLAVAERLADTATAFDELPAATRTAVPTTGPVDRAADLALRSLDA